MSRPAEAIRNPGRRRWHAFADAGRGIWILLKTQANARVHLAASVGAVGLAFALGLSGQEWALLILAMAAVWIAEGLNTALEFAVDLASPERRQLAGWAKDVAAGAVLVAALAALAVGAILFVPKLVALAPR